MKTRKILIAASVIVITGSGFFSCQKEQTHEPVKAGGIMSLKDVTAGTFFSYSNNPSFLGDPVTITFNNGLNNGCGAIKIQIWNPVTSVWELAAGPIIPVNGQASYTFSPDEIRNYKFRGSWTRTGSPSSCPGSNLNWQEAASDLTVIAQPTATLTGEAVTCWISREAVYSFIYPGEISYIKIQGSLTDFTGGDAVVTIISGESGWPVEFFDTGGGILEGQAGPYIIRQWIPAVMTNREISVEGPASGVPLVINVQWSSASNDAVITGVWSAKDVNGITLASVAGLACQY